MKLIKLPFLFVLIILILIRLRLTIAQPDFLAHYCNYDYTVTYTNGSTFQTNLDTIPSNLSAGSLHFYSFSIGLVNVIGLCRADVTADRCRTCFNNSITNLRKNCTNERQAIGWYDECMLRYSDLPIANKMEIVPNASAYNLNTISDPTNYGESVKTLLNRLSGEAAGGGSVRKFSTGNLSVPGNLTIHDNKTGTETRPSDLRIYGLAECTPDLSAKECGDCLNGAIEEFPLCCDGKIGARVLRPSCNLRYEIGPFYDNAPRPPLPNPPSPSLSPPGGSGNSVTTPPGFLEIFVIYMGLFVIF